jgi:hydrogenase maturation factor HypE
VEDVRKGVAMDLAGGVRRLLQPLASRKVRVALATVLAAYAAEHGLACSEELVLTIVSVGVAVILGIAHEDAGKAEAGSGSRVPGSGEQGTTL